MKIPVLLSNFVSGVVSDDFFGNIEFKGYSSSLSKLNNGYINEYGNICKRPGTLWLDSLDVDYDDLFLVPFYYDRKYYLLLFVLYSGNVDVYVVDDDKILKDDTGSYIKLSVDTDGSDNLDLKTLFYSQKDNVLYFSINGDSPVKLHKIELNNGVWNIGSITVNEFKMIMGYGDGSMTSTRFYLPNIIGDSTYGIKITINLSDGTTATAVIYPDGNNDLTNVSKLNINNDDKSIYIETSSSFAKGDPVVVEVKGASKDSDGNNILVDFDLRPYSITIYDSRLVWGGVVDVAVGKKYSQMILMSAIGDFSVYTLTPEGNQSIMFEIDTKYNDVINSIGNIGELFVGTNYNENVADFNSGFNVRRQSNYGSSNIMPVNLKSSIIFIDKSFSKVFAFYYDYRFRQFVVETLNKNIRLNNIKSIEYFYSDGDYLLLLFDDGKIGIFSIYSYDNVAFSVFYNDVNCKSIATVNNVIYGVFDRFGKITLEKFYKMKYDGYFDSGFVDCSVEYNGDLIDSYNVNYPDGTMLSVITDSGLHPDVVVENGLINFKWQVSKFVAGINYKFEFETVPVDFYSLFQISTVNRTKSISDFAVYLIKSLGGRIGGIDKYFFRKPSDLMNKPINLYTGIKNIAVFENVMSDNISINISQSIPTGFNVSYISFDMVVSK